MATLTQLAITTRKTIRYGIFFIIFLIILRGVISLGIKTYRRVFPQPPPPPTVSFGKLTKNPFPERAKHSFVFTLETPEGDLPTLPTQAKVYFMPRLGVTLLSLDRAREIANSLGFGTKEEKISETLYRFTHERANSVLELNIATGIFSISFNLSSDPSPLESRPPTPEIATSQLKSILSSASLFAPDLSGPATHEFLKVDQNKLASVPSLSEAHLIRVNFFRKSFDELPSLSPDPLRTNVWFIVSGSKERGKQIIAGQYHYFPVDETQYSTYPIKTSETAWQELQSGNAFYASVGENEEGGEVRIRRVYLAYYDSGIPTEFFQPIVVFEGDNGFVAYVPAVMPEYLVE